MKKQNYLKSLFVKSFNLSRKILEAFSGVGALREFLKPNDKYLCIDPHYKLFNTDT